MKFDLERAKKEGCIYIDYSGCEFPAKVIYQNQIMGPEICPGIVIIATDEDTEIPWAVYEKDFDFKLINKPRELWAAILQGHSGSYYTYTCSSKEEITGYIRIQSIKNVIAIKCIYREGEENEK